jgi:hypothetical protein
MRDIQLRAAGNAQVGDEKDNGASMKLITVAVAKA